VLTLTAAVVTAGCALADTIHLKDGKAIDCKITEVVGDLIYYKPKAVHAVAVVQRFRVNGPQDKVILRTGETIVGHVRYTDVARMEVLSDRGNHVLFKPRVYEVVIGEPALQPASHIQASFFERHGFRSGPNYDELMPVSQTQAGAAHESSEPNTNLWQSNGQMTPALAEATADPALSADGTTARVSPDRSPQEVGTPATSSETRNAAAPGKPVQPRHSSLREDTPWGRTPATTSSAGW
jgi:hypothetical protein